MALELTLSLTEMCSRNLIEGGWGRLSAASAICEPTV
jgi:hypothetical protein